MNKDLFEILGAGYEIATALGEKLGEAINDAIDQVFPASDNNKNNGRD